MGFSGANLAQMLDTELIFSRGFHQSRGDTLKIHLPVGFIVCKWGSTRLTECETDRFEVVVGGRSLLRCLFFGSKLRV